jgi:hypothetical protein
MCEKRESMESMESMEKRLYTGIKRGESHV